MLQLDFVADDGAPRPLLLLIVREALLLAAGTCRGPDARDRPAERSPGDNFFRSSRLLSGVLTTRPLGRARIYVILPRKRSARGFRELRRHPCRPCDGSFRAYGREHPSPQRPFARAVAASGAPWAASYPARIPQLKPGPAALAQPVFGATTQVPGATVSAIPEDEVAEGADDIASRLSRGSRRALSRAHASLEHAHDNWSGLLQRRCSSADASSAPAALHIARNPVARQLAQVPAWLGQHAPDGPFGALWSFGRPALDPFKVRCSNANETESVLSG